MCSEHSMEKYAKELDQLKEMFSQWSSGRNIHVVWSMTPRCIKKLSATHFALHKSTQLGLQKYISKFVNLF